MKSKNNLNKIPAGTLHGLRSTECMTATTYEHAKKTIVCATQLAAFLVMLDMMILFASLAQITAEGQSGYWSPFWSSQAKLAMNILK